jgi:selenocysteine-specific elongation factor
VYVICTAGHVDHGKSTLVRALTGMEPDRLAEEQRRSMTIDIGFAWCELPRPGGAGADTIAFVDLPGHHRFVANMLAGASSVGTALLVVGADDGPMPQTVEHLEILDLLGVRHGVVALTKTDTVDEATVAVAAELTREALAGTSLAGAPVVPVSAATGANLPALRAALSAALADLPAEEDLGRPRLWVDRSFSIRGSGTVVTGTLRHGSLAVDDEVLVAPGARPARVRGLQSLGRQSGRAAPGGRVAVNLVGLGRAEVRRGDAVVHPGEWYDVRVLEAWVRALPDRAISRRGDWHLHCGAGVWRVELRVVAGNAIAGGQAGYVRVNLPEPVPVAPGDRFVLRESGRQSTIGGGIVLDVAPARPARGATDRDGRAAALRHRLAAVTSGDRMGLIVHSTQTQGFVPRRDTMALAGLGPAAARLADPRLLALGDVWVDAALARRWRTAAVEAVGAQHARQPLARGLVKDAVVRTAVDAGCPAAVAPRLVADAIQRGELAVDGARLRLPGHRVTFDERQAGAAEMLLKLLDAGGFAPPELGVVVAEAGAQDLLPELEASGRLLRITPELALTPQMLGRAHTLLWEAFRQEGPLTASRARDVLDTTRKYVLPLLAALDQRGCTRREGDLRTVLDIARHNHDAPTPPPRSGGGGGGRESNPPTRDTRVLRF